MPSTFTPIARSPLQTWHVAQGARFAERDGWQTVMGYAATDRETEAPRTGLGLADISAFAKLSVRGPGVRALVQALVPDSRALNARGVAKIAPEPALACRLSSENLLLLQNPGCNAAVLNAKLDNLAAGNPRCLVADVTSALAGFLLIGPRLEDVLRRLTHLDVRQASFPLDSCAETSLAGVEATLVRTTESALPSLRVYVAWDLAEYIWEQILEAGHGVPVTPVGLEVLGGLLERK